jgi:hypothetical protein
VRKCEKKNLCGRRVEEWGGGKREVVGNIGKTKEVEDKR